ncbi:MAG: tRNA modification GTPase [Limisphaerales bacterium]|jgi:tRNA modification GTPase
MPSPGSLTDTIVAPATPPGVGAIAVVRVSGSEAIPISDRVFRGSRLAIARSHTAHYGHIFDRDRTVDEVLATVFRTPRSFTTEDTVEFSCHGSPYVVQEVIDVIIRHGARMAQPGEFTMRAFLHGRLDLAQAEAVADLIASNSKASHQVAINQMRGGISTRIGELRSKLVDFAALVELELDFAEEDVEFADRTKLVALITETRELVDKLVRSFKMGNALRLGVPAVIAGRPNAGKSTLLNALLEEDRAIVSEIPGTTRDTIEEVLTIEGVAFRLIDTAGLREATDVIEKIGVEKTMEKIRQTAILIYVFDLMTMSSAELAADLANLRKEGVPCFAIGNKIDLDTESTHRNSFSFADPNDHVFWISAEDKKGLETLRTALLQTVLRNQTSAGETVVANVRHYNALRQADESLEEVLRGLGDNLSGELVALDINRALSYLGEITGEVTNDEVLGAIFGKFCIGK